MATKKDTLGFVHGKGERRVRLQSAVFAKKFSGGEFVAVNVTSKRRSKFVETVATEMAAERALHPTYEDLAETVADLAVDLAYKDISVLEIEDSWGGDPREMPDEDLAFFGLSR